MPVFITDEDCLDKLTRIEGDFWRRTVENHADTHTPGDLGRPETMSLNRLRGLYDEWREILEEEGLAEDMGESVIGILYGAGGYNRYQLLASGEFIFLKMWASRLEKTTMASEAGFRLG